MDTCANLDYIGRTISDNNTRRRECLDLNEPPTETYITLHRSMAKQSTNNHHATTKPIGPTFNHHLYPPVLVQEPIQIDIHPNTISPIHQSPTPTNNLPTRYISHATTTKPYPTYQHLPHLPHDTKTNPQYLIQLKTQSTPYPTHPPTHPPMTT